MDERQGSGFCTLLFGCDLGQASSLPWTCESSVHGGCWLPSVHEADGVLLQTSICLRGGGMSGPALGLQRSQMRGWWMQGAGEDP